MQAFKFHNPTKIIFGENKITALHKELAAYGETVLLSYGGGSIKRNGIYDAVMAELEKAGKTVVELSGIMSNPRTTKVQEGVDLCKEHQVDFILAVGGGSTIDCSKAIAAAAKLPEDLDFWDHLYAGNGVAKEALPIGTVLTMAATGSEMNGGSVITNWEKQQKYSTTSPVTYPRFSILDPSYTYTLPREQVVYGVSDMLSHLMESYFSTPDAENVTDDLIESLMKTIMKNTDVALENLEDYTARANLMWAATLALNGITTLGKKMDWMSHNIEHSLSAFYDVPHGAGLAVVHPMLLEYICEDHVDRFVRFAKNVWGLSGEGKSDIELAHEGIATLRQYLSSIGCPITTTQLGIPETSLREIAESTRTFPTSYHQFTTEDIYNILISAK